MDSLSPLKFRLWIKNLIFTKREEGDCIAITLRHIAGKASGEVTKMAMPKPAEFEEGEDPDMRVGMMADEIWEKAQDDANGFQGMQTYAFYSWFDGSGDKHFNRFTCRFSPQTESDEMNDDESVSEAPTGTGLVTASMRHTEVFARVATQGSMHQIAMLQRTVESQQRLVEKLTENRMKTFELMEDLQSEKHKRDMEMKDKEAQVRFRTDMMDRVGMLLPIVASKMFKIPLLPAGSKGAPAMRELLGSVTEGQMEKLSSILTQEQQALLANMMMEQQDDDAKVSKPAEPNGEAH
jgi:cell division protein FtsB